MTFPAIQKLKETLEDQHCRNVERSPVTEISKYQMAIWINTKERRALKMVMAQGYFLII